MAWDRVWWLPMKKLDEAAIRAAAQQVAAGYEGVLVEVDREDVDFVTCFFSVPGSAESDGGTVEVSIYDMEGDGRLLSLEADVSDNGRAWEEANQLAEDMADALDGEPWDG